MKFVFVFFAHALQAKDFGVSGQTFLIGEENMIQYLTQNAQKVDMQKYAKVFSDQMLVPAAVGGIEKAVQRRTVQFDPTVTVKEDAILPDGTMLLKKGAKINPLESVDLPGGLLFFDGSDPDQVAWAEKEPKQFTWILVKGNPRELEAQQMRAVYFDMYGMLTTRFQITKVPAKVVQEKQFLKIEEIPVDRSGY